MSIYQKRRLVAFGVILALMMTATFPSVSRAQENYECAVSFQDLNHDGQPDLALIQCPFAGSESDVVYVYDRAGNMQAGAEWGTSVDFEDDLWLFDAGGDGSANLIIDFHRDGNQLVADLYDDQDEDRNVGYRVAGGKPTVIESDYPTVRLVAPDGWWLQGSKINYNLDIEVDGQVRASFNSPVVWLRSFPEWFRLIMVDGEADCVIHVRDVDNDGRPDYEIKQVYSPVAVSYGTELMVNTEHNEVGFTAFTFWPYLGTPSGYIKPYAGSIAPIQINWEASKIVAVAEFVASRGSDSNWFIYSSTRFGYGDRTYANFENPFAFYDLAADQDGYPELIIRMEYNGAHDPAFLSGRLSQAIQTIRLSWDQDNDGFWDYKVGFVGRHEITQRVTFPDFAVLTVPYTEFPEWVIGRRWDTAAFVAAENMSYSSSEGIYEGAPRAWRDFYVTGLANDPSLEQVQDTRQGLRLEYTPELQDRPWLYCSPIDRKLHLRHAWGGVWNLDDVHRVRYADLDGNGYLDQWMFTVRSEGGATEGEEVPEEFVKSLQVAGEMLVYGDADRVKLVRSEIAPSLFETLPPRDNAEWLALGEQLDRHQQDFAPDDFLGMMNQFQGPTAEIEGASLEDFRLTDTGFRFVLHLLPHFRVLTDANELGAADLPAGSYLATYGGDFQVRPLTPPHITLPASEIWLNPPRPTEMAWTSIEAALHNDGLQDVQSLLVRLFVAKEGGEPLLLAEEQVSVPGEGKHTLAHKFLPNEAGKWTIWVEADTEEALPAGVNLGTMARLEVEVEPATMPEMFRPAQAYDGIRFTWPVALLLGSVGLTAMVVLWLVLRQDTGTAVIEPIGGSDG